MDYHSLSDLVVHHLVSLLLMAPSSFLLFLKGSDGRVRPLGVSSGSILDVSENGNVATYDLSDDREVLKNHIEKMSIEGIKTTCRALGTRLSFSGGNPRKEHYVEAVLEHWDTIQQKVKTLSSKASSADAGMSSTAPAPSSSGGYAGEGSTAKW